MAGIIAWITTVCLKKTVFQGVFNIRILIRYPAPSRDVPFLLIDPYHLIALPTNK
jgi:hypothetical protein